MPAKKTAEAFAVTDSLLAAWATNDRINAYLIENLPTPAWRVSPPGGKGRDIAAIVAHMHNVRLMWLKATAQDAAIPAKLDPATCTPQDCVQALEASRAALAEVLREALTTDGRVKSFKPDACGFLAYLLAHDAHHRGQITMLARQLGHPLSKSAMFGLWQWGAR